MTDFPLAIPDFLSQLPPFDRLPPAALADLAAQLQPWRYRIGQKILERGRMPHQVTILYQGQARLLGFDPANQMPVTLQLLEPGAILGWLDVLREIACETAIASTDVVCLTLPIAPFLSLIEQHPQLRPALQDTPGLTELFDLLSAQSQVQSAGINLKDITLHLHPHASVSYLSPGTHALTELESDRVWLVSSGVVDRFPVGRALPQSGTIEVKGSTPARLVGVRSADWAAHVPFSESALPPLIQNNGTNGNGSHANGNHPGTNGNGKTGAVLAADIPYAPIDLPTSRRLPPQDATQPKYPFVGGKDAVDVALACFQMLSQHFGMAFRREVMRRVLDKQVSGKTVASLQLCASLSELMGLSAQLVTVPTAAVSRLQTPALIHWQGSLALVYEVGDREVVLAVPEIGIQRHPLPDFLHTWGGLENMGQVLLLQPTKETPQQRFGVSWFLPYIAKFRSGLLIVFLASFFVQLFGLANPLMTQIIIDQVIINNSLDTLQVLGVLLIVVAIFDAVLSSLRTYMFTEITNRIDLALGAEIIGHLLRLPLRYFDRRPVGELATRINELENIRQFLTGTALTVVLDSVFSVLYIAVMLVYSWLLTAVALSTIPLFALLALAVTPIIRKQLRVKAEHNAHTQSHLVEVLSGIQTVKAQNIELRSRWQWQERYARYVSASFKTVVTFTTASSTSNFLNQLSGLLVLCVGAYLMVDKQLSLGQLIAFRIIAGYVTSPLLRLVQLWQNFQETALSFERLADIVDTPPEADELDHRNIPMPVIRGAVTYENVSFRFAPSGPMQLSNISVDFPAGVLVGIAGQSGSGKSSLMKLLPRLYELNGGRILIDDYDISKVELYSLRSQIGIIPQDPLLFDGSVQENIGLTTPDAATDDVIAAAKLAVAHDFIMSLPNGYNTRVGERGSNLSGGQRQRIAIARTILQNPQLLILDEATSALDYDTERQVCRNLTQAFRGRTVFFITHRLGSIQQADLILMMHQGTIAEQGTHAELMALRGRYYCLYQQQESQVVATLN